MFQQLLREAPDAGSRERNQLWRAASLTSLALRARDLEATGKSTSLMELRSLAAVRSNLPEAQRHIQQSLYHCSLARGGALTMSRLAFLGSSPQTSRNASYLRMARYVAPSTPSALMELALLADASLDLEFADECWRRCVEIAPEESPTVWKAASRHRTTEQMLADVLPVRVDVLVATAESISDEATRRLVANRAEMALEQPDPPVGPLDRARVAELQSQPDVAIEQYRLALSENPWESEARLRLARLLHQQGRLAEAESEYSLLSSELRTRKEIQEEMAALKQELQNGQASPLRSNGR
jgi:tetratricopeptide (TPR) repeat protein